MSNNNLDIVGTNILNNENKIKIHPLITLSQNLLFFIDLGKNKFCLCYVLQDRHLLMSNNKSAHIKEILIAMTSKQELVSLINQDTSIYDTLNKNKEKYLIGKIADKIFPSYKIKDLNKIKDMIPDKNYFLELNDETKLNLKNILS